MWRLTGEHLIRNGAERVDVASPVDDAVAGGLLRTHVLRCSERQPCLRDSVSAGVTHGQRYSEISDNWLARLHENVFGLEVAVNDAVRVCVVERVGNSDSDSNCLIDGKLFFTIEPRAKRLAVHERHYIVEQTI